MRHKLNPTSAGPSRTRYVIEGDIKGCFDAIDHHVLMDRVRRRQAEQNQAAEIVDPHTGEITTA